MKKAKTGFTLVELLIVIVVIAILAAISVVAYNGIQNRSHNAAVQSDLRNFANRLKLHQADKGSLPRGTGPTSTMIDFEPVAVSKSSYSNATYNFYYCRGIVGGSEQFAIVGISKSGTGYKYESVGGPGAFTDAIGGSGAACDGTNVPRSSTDFSYSYGQNVGTNDWYPWIKNS